MPAGGTSPWRRTRSSRRRRTDRLTGRGTDLALPPPPSDAQVWRRWGWAASKCLCCVLNRVLSESDSVLFQHVQAPIDGKPHITLRLRHSLRGHVRWLSRHTRWVAGAVGLPLSTQADPHLNLRGYFIHHLRGLLNICHGDARVLTEEALDGDRRAAALQQQPSTCRPIKLL